MVVLCMLLPSVTRSVVKQEYWVRKGDSIENQSVFEQLLTVKQYFIVSLVGFVERYPTLSPRTLFRSFLQQTSCGRKVRGFRLKQALSGCVIGDQHVNELTSQCRADRIEFLRTTRDPYDVIDPSNLIQCETNDPVIQIRRNHVTTVVKIAQVNVANGPEVLQCCQLLPGYDTPFPPQNGFRAR